MVTVEQFPSIQHLLGSLDGFPPVNRSEEAATALWLCNKHLHGIGLIQQNPVATEPEVPEKSHDGFHVSLCELLVLTMNAVCIRMAYYKEERSSPEWPAAERTKTQARKSFPSELPTLAQGTVCLHIILHLISAHKGSTMQQDAAWASTASGYAKPYHPSASRVLRVDVPQPRSP